MKRVGIFQFEWPLQVHTTNLALKLAEAGIQVDIYLYACDTSLEKPSALSKHPNARFFIFDNNKSLVSRVVNRIVRDSRKILGFPYRRAKTMLAVVDRTLKCIGSSKYDYFIGIEKAGLIWAGKLSEQLGVPYLYYSLELYIEGHPAVNGESKFASIRSEEKTYHARAAGTIIQDALRSKVLFESNGIKTQNTIYIPVSVSGKRVTEKSHFLHDRLGIPITKKIILYMGMIAARRGINEMMQCATRLLEDYVIVFHGPVFSEFATDDNCGGKVYFSLGMVSSEDIPRLISSAHIGIAIYENSNANERLTAFSSEKIAYYVQSGLPIIVRHNESYDMLMSKYRCGVQVEHIHQLPKAVEKIDGDYACYRKNAFAAFDHYYSFDNNVRALTEYLSNH
ncbi:MAG: hypothetical protein P8047_15830 [Gammaproteobacteria bacterium]